jgi:hypothetical protein
MKVFVETEGAIMKRVKAVLTSSLILLGAAASAPALADGRGGGHVRFGVFIGAPFYPWYYPPYYYYPPTVVTVPATPPTYVERGGSQVAPGQQQSYWYYCTESKTYYPYVKECPGGWQRVVPQPPG